MLLPAGGLATPAGERARQYLEDKEEGHGVERLCRQDLS